MGGTRDLIRGKTVGGKKDFRRKELELVIDGEPVKVAIRVPSVAERQAIFKAGQMDSKGMIGDMAALQIETVLCCAVDPETGVNVFERADVENFKGQPSGGWFDTLAAAAAAMLSPQSEDARKNS